jgi:hypothetical protein
MIAMITSSSNQMALGGQIWPEEAKSLTLARARAKCRAQYICI